jgi:hypothetical protein
MDGDAIDIFAQRQQAVRTICSNWPSETIILDTQ